MDRKNFLKSFPLLGAAGGLTLLGCSTGVSANEEDLSGDLLIISNAAEREAIAVNTYTSCAPIIESSTIKETALLYQSHHNEHFELFNEFILEFGGTPVELEAEGADSRVGRISNQADVISLAMTLEFEAAQAYFLDAVQNLRNARTREVMGSIYPVELVHYVTLKSAIGEDPNISAATFSEIAQNFEPF